MKDVQPAVVARVAVLVTTLSLTALAADVEVRCARLDGEAAAELRARARLTLRAAPEPPRAVALECGGGEAWLLWEAAGSERLSVDESAGLVEGALRAIEQRLDRDEGRDAPTEELTVTSRPGESLALAADPEPTFERTAPRSEAARDRHAGGVAAGLDLEPRSSAPALGPRLDLGVGVGKVALIATQALRLGTTDATYLFDTRLGFGWGAPFAVRRWFGVEAFGGVQGLSGVGREVTTPGRRSDSTLVLGAGARVALMRAVVAPELGLDLSWRTRTLKLDEPYDLELSRWQVGMSLGVAYRVTAAERPRAR